MSVCKNGLLRLPSKEWEKDGKPQYYCAGWIDKMTDEPLPECQACSSHVSRAQADLDAWRASKEIVLVKRFKFTGDVFNALVKECEWDLDAAASLLNSIPDAKVVEVIHCGECEFYEPIGPACEHGCGLTGPNYPDDFCSYGRRKKDKE